jgi:hypothetical protein
VTTKRMMDDDEMVVFDLHPSASHV